VVNNWSSWTSCTAHPPGDVRLAVAIEVATVMLLVGQCFGRGFRPDGVSE
jgi:hypothetical protein